jgi:hypothetical protein
MVPDLHWTVNGARLLFTTRWPCSPRALVICQTVLTGNLCEVARINLVVFGLVARPATTQRGVDLETVLSMVASG